MRMLIVEDDENELDELGQHLQSCFPGITLLKARSAEEAHAALRTLRWQNKALDVAILDILLCPGEYELKLPYFIRGHFGACLILHYTVYADEAVVQEHAKVRFSAQDEIIRKGAETSLKQLRNLIQQYWEHRLLTWAKECLRPAHRRARTGDVPGELRDSSNALPFR